MTTVTFEVTVQEGYRDERGPRRETLGRVASMSCVPRVGEAVDMGYGHADVGWLDWSPWDDGVFIRLDGMFTCSDPFDGVLTALRKEGWR